MTAAFLSVVTQKLRLRLRMCVAHVPYIYLIHTYINIYNDMYGVLGPPARRGFAGFCHSYHEKLQLYNNLNLKIF